MVFVFPMLAILQPSWPSWPSCSPGWSTILSIESRVLKYMMEYMKTSDFRSPKEAHQLGWMRCVAFFRASFSRDQVLYKYFADVIFGDVPSYVSYVIIFSNSVPRYFQKIQIYPNWMSAALPSPSKSSKSLSRGIDSGGGTGHERPGQSMFLQFRSNLMQHDTTHINHHQATKNPPNSNYSCGNSQETPKLQMALGPQVNWGYPLVMSK